MPVGFAPFADPDIWRFLLGGLAVTLQVALLTIGLSLAAAMQRGRADRTALAGVP